MNYKFVSVEAFTREVKRLSKRYRSLQSDLINLRDELQKNPALGIDLGGGLRKIRMAIASKGRGKSGGARVVTFTILTKVDETTVNLLYIYDKAERESISTSELQQILKKRGFTIITEIYTTNKMKREETDYISKEEILNGISEGLHEVRLAMDGKVKSKTAREFLEEL